MKIRLNKTALSCQYYQKPTTTCKININTHSSLKQPEMSAKTRHKFTRMRDSRNKREQFIPTLRYSNWVGIEQSLLYIIYTTSKQYTHSFLSNIPQLSYDVPSRHGAHHRNQRSSPRQSPSISTMSCHIFFFIPELIFLCLWSEIINHCFVLDTRFEFIFGTLLFIYYSRNMSLSFTAPPKQSFIRSLKNLHENFQIFDLL